MRSVCTTVHAQEEREVRGWLFSNLAKRYVINFEDDLVGLAVATLTLIMSTIEVRRQPLETRVLGHTVLTGSVLHT